jgi:hypothetical protein
LSWESGTFKLDSDINFAADASTGKDFNRFIGKQGDWFVPSDYFLSSLLSDPHPAGPGSMLTRTKR